ncbi:hypothetical protein [Maritimibacter sp. DP1N21-5]|nr:hypothetical protein [Maritimibacter sp. DP1N21-5]
MPFSAVWAEFCARNDRPTGKALTGELDGYQAKVSARGA